MRLTCIIMAMTMSLTATMAFCQEGHDSGKEESYEVRPDILSIPAEENPMLGDFWYGSLRGHVETLALLLEMYADHEIYFLARDGEHLYDIARVASREDRSIDFSKIHLINVSRANVKDKNLGHYLFQEGISEQDLKKGKKIVLVDTGLKGTIPMQIQDMFAPYVDQIKVQLLSSQNPLFPSTNSFLYALDPQYKTLAPWTLHALIKEYEQISRYTGRSLRFAKEGRRWHPISFIPLGAEERSSKQLGPDEMRERAMSANDNLPNRVRARAFMADLRAYMESAEARELLARRRSTWRSLRTLLDRKDLAGITALVSVLLSEKDQEEAGFNRAMILDFISVAVKNLRMPLQIAKAIRELLAGPQLDQCSF